MLVKAKSKVFNIEVKQKHIDKANEARSRYKYNACSSCPVAQAVREQVGTKKKIEVTSSHGIYIDNHSFGTTNIKDGRKVDNLISRFDAKFPIKPTKFKIANLYIWS